MPNVTALGALHLPQLRLRGSRVPQAASIYQHADFHTVPQHTSLPLTAMDLPRGRCSSIPRDYTKRRRRGFSIEDASVLRVKLVALDKLLDSAPIAEHHALDFEQALQQQGPAEPDKELTESLFDLLDESKIPCPDGIATAFVQAYTAALAGHQYVNEYKIIDLTKGPECTCSMALNILFQIDVLLNTKLRTHFNAVYARGTHVPKVGG